MSIDNEVLEPFREVFEAMNISGNQVALAAESFSLPELSEVERRELSAGKPVAPETLSEMMKHLAPLTPFAYKEHIVLVYIRDQLLSREAYERGDYNRYHLCFCQHLRGARRKNRYEARYVMTYDTSGNFLVNLSLLPRGERREQNVYRRLKVCQYCLRELNWKNFRQYCGAGRAPFIGGDRLMRQRIVEAFDIAEYLLTAQRNQARFFPPVDAWTPKKEYVLPPSWKTALKRNVDYRCELCRQRFAPDALEIHHRNHNQGDNRRDNLMVLCRACHDKIHAAEGGVCVKPKHQTDYADALKTLGDIHVALRDEAAAKNFYRRASVAYEKLSGDLDATFELANLYLREPKTASRAQQLFEAYLRRADNGGAKERIRRGLIYAKGLGVSKNLNKARQCFTAVEGNTEVFIDDDFIELARLIGHGGKAERLRAQAIELFEAAAQGDAAQAVKTQAFGELVRLYGESDGEEVLESFFDEARRLFGEKVSTHDKILEQFNAVKRGDLALVERLKQSARLGDVAAQAVLERLYRDAEQVNPRGVIVLREGLQSISERQFYNRRQITHVVFPETLEAIGDEAFKACGLKSLVLPAALKQIGAYAFQDSAQPVEAVTYHKQIEWRLREYFGDRWDSISKTPRD